MRIPEKQSPPDSRPQQVLERPTESLWDKGVLVKYKIDFFEFLT